MARDRAVAAFRPVPYYVLAAEIRAGGGETFWAFWVPPEGDNFDAAVKELDTELSKTIKNLKTTFKGTVDTHNGMPHITTSGTGEVDGTTIEWGVDMLRAKQTLIVLSFAAPGVAEKHAKEAEWFFNNLKKIE